MSADHSPLPWTVRPCERDGESVISGAEPRDANGRTVFTVDLGDYCGLSEETAALIVTAVNAHEELLAACKRAIDQDEGRYRCLVGESDGDCARRNMRELHAQFKAAIALAEAK